MQTTVINLYGGPGIGKSTSAASIFASLKRRGLTAELVSEYVKKWAWAGRQVRAYDQVYLLGKQSQAEASLYGKVSFVITDSPILQNLLYSRRFCPPKLAAGIEQTAMALLELAESEGHKHVHVLLQRSKPYSQAGRYQSESEARELDPETRRLLEGLGLPWEEADTEPESLEALVRKVGERWLQGH